jgi:hypothetical protein
MVEEAASSPARPVPRGGRWLEPALAAALLLLALASTETVWREMAPRFGSDEVQIFLLVEELRHRGADLYWAGTSNPYLFPPTLFLAIGRLFASSVIGVHAVAYAAHLAALFGALYVLARAVHPTTARRRAALGAALGTALYGLAAGTLPAFGWWISMPPQHGMHWPLVPLVCAWALRALCGPRGVWLRAALAAGAMAAFGIASDRILALWMLAPTLLLAAIDALRASGGRRRSTVTALLLAASVPAALGLLALLAASGRFAYGSSGYDDSLVGSPLASLRRFLGDFGRDPEIAAVVTVALTAAVAIGVVLVREARLGRLDSGAAEGFEGRLARFALWCLGALGLAGAAIFAGGFWTTEWATRFLQPFLVVPISWIAVTTTARRGGGPLREASPALFLLVAGGLALSVEARGEGPLRTGPEAAVQAERLASLVRGAELGGGLAHYWQVGRLRAWSDAALPLAPFYGDEPTPILWGGSPDWHFENPGIDFLVADGVDAIVLRARFGSPRCVLDVEGLEVWLFDDADTARLCEFRAGALAEAERKGFRVRPEWTASLAACRRRAARARTVPHPCERLAPPAAEFANLLRDGFEGGDLARWLRGDR